MTVSDAPAFTGEPSAAELIAARPGLRVHAMDGLLFDGMPLARVAQSWGTPCWVTGAATLRRRFRALSHAMPGVAIHYAVKANDHLAILAVLAAEGAGADVVSGGELLRALQAGIPPQRIVFSGVGKTAAELSLALANGIGQLNVESAEELDTLSALAVQAGRTAHVALRVNPDVDAGTHDKISTGRAEDKFGVPWRDAARVYAQAAALPGIAPVGLAVHIGSQIGGTAAFASAYTRLAGLVRMLRTQGLTVETVDCGGGLGISYAGEPSMLPQAWAACIGSAFGTLGLRLAIEPGRWLVGPAGLLLASVVRTRRAGRDRPVVILDAAMNDLVRPALYGAWHGIVPVSAACLAAPVRCADIVGPVCETADMFAQARAIADMPEGAVVAILDTGAYGAVMSSTYNARPQAAQAMIDPTLPSGLALIRARLAPRDLWAADIVPARVA